MMRKGTTVLKYQKSVCCNYNTNFKLIEIKHEKGTKKMHQNLEI